MTVVAQPHSPMTHTPDTRFRRQGSAIDQQGAGSPRAIIGFVSKSRTASRSTAAPLLSLRDAATLAGVPRRVLRGRVQRGEIPVRLLGTGKRPKVRLTPAALVAAGLLADDVAVREVDGQATPADLNLALLLEMIRDQNRRIAALEDQRFQLAAELGATVERARTLAIRLAELPSATRSPGAGSGTVPSEAAAPSPAVRSDLPEPPADARKQPERVATPEAAPSDRQAATSRQLNRDQPPRLPSSGGSEPSRAWRAGALVRRGAVRLLTTAGTAPTRNVLA